MTNSVAASNRSLIGRALRLRCSQKGQLVAEFEREFAQYVGAKYAVAHCNGTCTMHSALVALGVRPGDRVAVPPLTYASTTLAVLHAGAVPVYQDVHRRTWLAFGSDVVPVVRWKVFVSLYGLGLPPLAEGPVLLSTVDDAAETLNLHNPDCAFTSYSFEASKILPIGEGGMLVTNDEGLAWKARQFHTVGYHQGGPEDERTNGRSPQVIRHDVIGWNYQMSDVQAAVGLMQLERADELLAARRYSAACYRQAIQGCEWITPQYAPEGWPHSYWTYGIALRGEALWEPFAHALVEAGGEHPYGCFRLTYDEPAFHHLAPPSNLWKCDTCGSVRESNKLPATLRCTHWGGDCLGTAYPTGGCPVAEDLQPRLVQLQTNHDHAGAERAADCLRKAIRETKL
jgi:perosamine synthetase